MVSTSIVRIPLAWITTANNPRCPSDYLASALATELDWNGTIFEFSKQCIQACVDFSDPIKQKRARATMEQFVWAIEEFAGETERSEPPPTLLALAKSRLDIELQPIALRVIGQKRQAQHPTYGIIFGERRFIAAVYNLATAMPYCKLNSSRWMIGATTHKCSKDAALECATAENLHRKDMSDLDLGELFEWYKVERGLSYKEIAVKLNLPDYQFVTGRAKLAHLSPDDKERFRRGELNLKQAMEAGSAVKQKRTSASDVPGRRENRQRVMTIANVRKVFDQPIPKDLQHASPESVYRATLAMVMQITLEQAYKESEERAQ